MIPLGAVAQTGAAVSGGGGGGDTAVIEDFTVNTTENTDDQNAGTIPAGTQVGDLLIAHVIVAFATDVTNPTGWTRELGAEAPGGDGFMGVFSRIADGTEGAEVNFVTGSGNASVAAVLRISGHHASNFMNAKDLQNNGSSTSHPTPSIDTTVDDTLLLGFVHLDEVASSFTPPSGFTELYDQDNTSGFRPITSTGANSTQDSAGSTGVHTFTSAIGRPSQTALIAIAPA